ncbi:MAG: MFS transporter [Promethearchaeota archaeon]
MEDSKDERRNFLIVVLVLSLLGHFGSSAWDVVFPDLVVRAGGAVALWGWAYAAFNLTQFLFQIPNAWLSDKYGRRRVIGLCLVVYGTGSTLALWAGSPAMLIAARAVQGVGAISAIVLAAVTDYSTEETKGLAVAGRNLTQVLGWVGGMMVGGLLADAVGLEASIWLCVGVGFGGAFLSFGFLRERPARERPPAPPRTGTRPGITPAIPSTPAGARDGDGGASGVGGGDAAPTAPSWFRTITRLPSYQYGLAFGAIRYLLYQAVVTYALWYMAGTWHFSSTQRALTLFPVIVSYVAGLFLAGKVTSRKVHNLRLTVLAFSMVACGTLLVGLTPVGVVYLLLLALVILSFGFGVAHTTLTFTIVSDLGERVRGAGSGFAMTVQYAMIVLAPLVMSYSAGAWGDVVPFFLAAALALVVAVLALALGKMKHYAPLFQPNQGDD